MTTYTPITHHLYFMALSSMLPLAIGCGSEDDANRRYTAMGALCVAANEGSTVTFSAIFDEPCLESCITTAQSCEATVSGDGLIALAAALEVKNEPPLCTTGCQARVASCNLNLATPGNYRVVLDDGRTAEVALPVEAPILLLGEGECAQE